MIAYRREDSAGWARSIHDRLVSRFGSDQVFMDVDTIMPGDDFVEAIDREIRSCDVMLAVVGLRWLREVDARGRRGLFDERDYLRLEVEAALNRGVALIPVLIEGAVMPEESELPASIAALARRQAYKLDATTFSRDVDGLVQLVGERMGPQSTIQKGDAALRENVKGSNVEGSAAADQRRRRGRSCVSALLLAVVVLAVVISLTVFLGGRAKPIRFVDASKDGGRFAQRSNGVVLSLPRTGGTADAAHCLWCRG